MVYDTVLVSLLFAQAKLIDYSLFEEKKVDRLINYGLMPSGKMIFSFDLDLTKLIFTKN